MTNIVNVPFGESMADTATLLLEAAEKTDNEANVVTVDHFTNSYRVPEEVAKKAGLDFFDPDADFAAQVEAAQGAEIGVNAAEVAGEKFADPGPSQIAPEAAPKPAKKAAARKRTAKKATAKKTAAKKS